MKSFIETNYTGLRLYLNRSALLWLAVVAALLVPIPAPSQSVPSPADDGFWRSDGYGFLIEIRGSHMKAFETTSISCLLAWSAERDSALSKEGVTVFAREKGLVTIGAGPSHDQRTMQLSYSVSPIGLQRLAQAPETCSQPMLDTPSNNYAVFWQTFSEQFALFPAYPVDWGRVDREYRPRVTSRTVPEELFKVLTEMVDPFHNAHIDVRAKAIGREYWGYKPTSDVLQTKHADAIRQIIETRYLDGKLHLYCNGNVGYGTIHDKIGFLRILSFENYTAEELEPALDEIFSQSSKLKGLIIDVRINEGGSDAYGLAIASRLTGTRYFAYSKVARNSLNGPLSFTAPESSWVPSTSRPGFLGEVVLLTGPDSFSAAETFAMALMNRKPSVTRIGEDTQGVFSDKLRRRLPNGWSFALPNEVYLTQSGKSYDVIGVPPDIRVPVFDANDVAEKRDRGIDKALEVLALTRGDSANERSGERR